MKHVFLAFGSNIGSSKEIISKAYKKITRLKFVQNPVKSPFYETTPVSDIVQNNFINMVCGFDTALNDPFILLKEAQAIEEDLGKIAKPKNAPRAIDIDILLFKELYHNDSILELPHPRMLERLFVIEPLTSITPSIIYPRSSLEIQKIDLEELLLNFENKNNELVKEIL